MVDVVDRKEQLVRMLVEPTGVLRAPLLVWVAPLLSLGRMKFGIRSSDSGTSLRPRRIFVVALEDRAHLEHAAVDDPDQRHLVERVPQLPGELRGERLVDWACAPTMGRR